MSKSKPDEFLHGVWVAIEFLVLMADQPTHAQEIAESCGIDLKTAYALSKLTGYRTREMRRWSRENLKRIEVPSSMQEHSEGKE